MHGLLAIVNCVTILCYPLVYVHCGPVVDFFITKQTSLHPFDFVSNLFHLLVHVQSYILTISFFWYMQAYNCILAGAYLLCLQ